jgi:hypothetical protein
MRWALIENNVVANVVEQDTQPQIEGLWVECGNAGPRMEYIDGVFIFPTPPVAPVLPNLTEWLIDVGSFFDRFGSSKIPALASQDITVRAIIQDCQTRRWIDLQRADVGQAIDVMIAAGISGMDAALKDAILLTPVDPSENLALRKLFFGG